MKQLILVSILASTLFAQADEVEQGAIDFPGAGKIPSNKVCVDQVHGVLRATLPAVTKLECADSSIDRTDPDHPFTVCRKYESINHPQQTVETPIVSTQTGCVKSHIEHIDASGAKTVCDEQGPVKTSQSLTYQMQTYTFGDPAHQNAPFASQTYNIPNCQ